jgi:hypothetical protein
VTGRLRAALALAACALAAAGRAGAATPEAELAARYAPAVRLVSDAHGCENGDTFVPTDVDALFGNDQVVLRGPWDRVNVVKVAPAATDLASGRVDYHLDFPGDPLSPGCTYAEFSQRVNAGRRPTVYAHVATDPAHPGKLALQYWFFYVFNDFNNLHEGDWEMIQLDFDARSAADALTKQPIEVGYSQHEGAERAAWSDDKVERVDGTHPVVYPAAGSHANFYSQALFLGRSAAQGVGCDDTEGDHVELRPAVAVIPSASADYLRAYPWLGFRGRWGELRPAFYNGPTGPNLKLQWTRPITWSEGWRDSSFAVPGGKSFGPQATRFFCDAVARGSSLLTRAVRNPLESSLVLVAVLALLAFAASRTSWRGSAPLRIARRRTFGEIVTDAWGMYRRRFRTFAGIGLLFIPFGIVISLVQYLVFRVAVFAPLVETAGESNVSVAGLAFSLGVFFTVVALTFVQAATALAVTAVDRAEAVTAADAYRRALSRLRPLLGALVIAAVVVAVLELTLVGIPVALWLVVRWSLIAQVVAIDGESTVGALRGSGALVRGRWWRVALFTVVVTGAGLLLGPLVGGVLLLATDAAFDVVNLVAAIVYSVTMPFVAVATTYLYYDLTVRRAIEEREAVARDVLPAEI